MQNDILYTQYVFNGVVFYAGTDSQGDTVFDFPENTPQEVIDATLNKVKGIFKLSSVQQSGETVRDFNREKVTLGVVTSEVKTTQVASE